MTASSLNSRAKRAAVSLASVFAFRMLGLFMLMPVLAIYGQDLSGFSPLWIGFAIVLKYWISESIFFLFPILLVIVPLDLKTILVLSP